MAAKTALRVGTEITPDMREASHFIEFGSVKRPVNPEVDWALKHVALPLAVGVIMLGATLVAINQIQIRGATKAPVSQVQTATDMLRK